MNGLCTETIDQSLTNLPAFPRHDPHRPEWRRWSQVRSVLELARPRQLDLELGVLVPQVTSPFMLECCVDGAIDRELVSSALGGQTVDTDGGFCFVEKVVGSSCGDATSDRHFRFSVRRVIE